MNRRSLLRTGAVVGVTATAGCTLSLGDQVAGTAPKAALRMEPISDREITRRLYRTASPHEKLFGEIVTSGGATRESVRPRFRDGDRVVYDGTLYEVSTTVEGATAATTYPVEINNVAWDSVTPAPNAKRVRYSDLPEVDKKRFREYHIADGHELGIGINLRYTAAERARSTLIPPDGHIIIVWESSGTRGQFSLRSEPWGVQKATYRYTAEVVAESAASYGRSIREQYAVTFSGLSEAESEILQQAVDGGYRVPRGSTPSDGFQSLVSRFRDVIPVPDSPPESTPEENDGQATGTYLVRFKRTVYWTDLVLHEEGSNQ